jgi:Cdc6-like AAA superfamily ATPase
MIENARVLRDGWVPGDVVHRDQEIDALSAALAPIADGRAGEKAMLSGPSGTGKTCIARYLVRELEREVLDLATVYVDCWRSPSGFETLWTIHRAAGTAGPLDRHGTSKTEVVEALADADAPIVVLLDEADQLDDRGILYDLHSIQGLTPVLIANREAALFDRFDERVASRYRGARSLQFDRYTLDELVAILEPRVEEGLERQSVTSGTLAAIADRAAGDARLAITLLRTAAQRASDEGTPISPSLVADVEAAAREERKQKDLSRLTRHQRIVYESLSDCGESRIGPVVGEYRSRVSEPRSPKTVRRYLKKMADYNLVRIEGSKRGRTYESV